MQKIRSIFLALFILSLIFVVFTIINTCGQKHAMIENEGVNALFLVARNYGLNSFLLWDGFEQYGWKFTYAGVLDTIRACPPIDKQLGIPPIIPDILVSEMTDIKDYDCLIIPPASGFYLPVPNPFGDLLESPEALHLIATAAKEGLPVYATCAGVRVLAAADVINGKKVVGAPKFESEYKEAGATFLGKDYPPLIEGNIITSVRGQLNNFANCQAVATVLESRQKTGLKKHSKTKYIVSGEANFASEDIVWAKTYGGLYAEGGRTLCQTNDGGFLLVGYTFSHGSGDADILVIKTTNEGNLVWSKTFGGAATEYGYGCAVIDNSYLITGYTTSFGAGSKDVYVIKLDADGNEIWSKPYGGFSWDVGTSICTNGDGGYFIGGFTHSFGSGEEDVYLIKIDADGKEIWSKTYGGARAELANSVFLNDAGGYTIGATTGTFGDGNSNFYLIKVDANGNKIWTKSYASHRKRGYGFDWCTAIYPKSEGGYFITGYSDCTDIMDAYVIKVDSDGNEIWAKSLGNKPFYDYGNAVCETKDGGCLVAGITKSIVKNAKTNYNNDIYLVKLDTDGNLLWEKTIGGSGSDWASSIFITSEGDAFVLGHSNSYGMGSFDVCLLKVKNSN